MVMRTMTKIIPMMISKIHDRREAFDLIELQTNSYTLLMESNEN
jgi:hypothetical protein